MSEETTPVTESAEAPAAPAKKKARKTMAARKPKVESNGHTGVRVTDETGAKINKLAAQIQLKTGVRTKAGEAVDAAVSKMLKE